MQPQWVMNRLLNQKSLQYFEGNSGDCTIVNTQECIHAASIPKKNSYRDMLEFDIYPDIGNVKEAKKLFLTAADSSSTNKRFTNNYIEGL